MLFMGKFTKFLWWFSIVMLNYQRVDMIQLLWYTCWCLGLGWSPMSSIFSIERTEHKYTDIEHMDSPSGNVTAGYGKSQFYHFIRQIIELDGPWLLVRKLKSFDHLPTPSEENRRSWTKGWWNWTRLRSTSARFSTWSISISIMPSKRGLKWIDTCIQGGYHEI